MTGPSDRSCPPDTSAGSANSSPSPGPGPSPSSGHGAGSGGAGGVDRFPAEVAVLTLYFRVGCHLCEDMLEQLTELFEPGSFRLETIDIDQDPVLKARYDVDVPVLAHPEGELCRHFLDPLTVKEWLASYNGGLT